MKTKNIFRVFGLAMLSTIALSSCQDVLDEQPRSSYDPTFFKTEEGVKGGLTALYAHLRNLYGQAYYFTSCEAGTDEYTYGHSADGNQKDIDMTGVGQVSSTSVRSDALWGQAFSDINTASAVIENASEVGIADNLVAEAYFFRGFYYFKLVQTFGGVPLDLGGGELHSNTAPKRTSERNTVVDVYTKAVFPDLEKAVADLPESPRLVGALTKNVARLFLANAYLTYGWWLENPQGIATYPECSRDASQANSYYQKAYDTAKAAIANPGPYKLQDTYFDVNFWQNDRNAEWLLWADHNQDDDLYNGGGLGWGNGGAPENFAGWFTQWNYCGDMRGEFADGSVGNPVLREACQALGRPWTRMAPIPDGLKKFTDVDKDSRWDGTFTTSYRVNMAKGGNTNAYVKGANGAQIKNGEVFLQFLSYDDPSVVYNQANGQINAGTLAGHDEFVINISDISRQSFPGVWKNIGHRTDRGEASELGNPNGSSPRPFPIAKFSEFYLTAAEAAVKLGKNSEARELVNVLRARAGKWKTNFNEYTYLCSNSGYGSLVIEKDFSKELTDATPATITIDYILDERLREFWGEGYRWFDLARTQTWHERAKVYHIADGNGRQAVEKVRDIQKHYYLRPIPQGQLDALQMTPEEKKAYQNPGY